MAARKTKKPSEYGRRISFKEWCDRDSGQVDPSPLWDNTPEPPMINLSRLSPDRKRKAWERIKSKPDVLEIVNAALPLAKYFNGEIRIRTEDLKNE